MATSQKSLFFNYIVRVIVCSIGLWSVPSSIFAAVDMKMLGATPNFKTRERTIEGIVQAAHTWLSEVLMPLLGEDPIEDKSERLLVVQKLSSVFRVLFAVLPDDKFDQLEKVLADEHQRSGDLLMTFYRKFPGPKNSLTGPQVQVIDLIDALKMGYLDQPDVDRNDALDPQILNTAIHNAALAVKREREAAAVASPQPPRVIFPRGVPMRVLTLSGLSKSEERDVPALQRGAALEQKMESDRVAREQELHAAKIVLSKEQRKQQKDKAIAETQARMNFQKRAKLYQDLLQK